MPVFPVIPKMNGQNQKQFSSLRKMRFPLKRITPFTLMLMTPFIGLPEDPENFFPQGNTNPR